MRLNPIGIKLNSAVDGEEITGKVLRASFFDASGEKPFPGGNDFDRTDLGVDDAYLASGDDAPLHREFLGHFHKSLRLTDFSLCAAAEFQTGLYGKTRARNIEVDLDAPLV